MNIKVRKIINLHSIRWILCIAMLLILGCGITACATPDITGAIDETARGTDNESLLPEPEIESPAAGESEDDAEYEEAEKEEAAYDEEDLIDFNIDDAMTYCSAVKCTYEKLNRTISYQFIFENGIPRSDDNYIYLFGIAPYEDEAKENLTSPLTQSDKGRSVELSVDYTPELLFLRFVPALLVDGEYLPVCTGLFVSNPEDIAVNNRDYPQDVSKKGVLLDGTTINTDKLENLRAARLVYNIPLSYVMGPTDDENYPTIEYEYAGNTYLFNGYICMIYDSLFTSLTNQGYHCTAIVLNDWNEEYPQMLHPKSREKTKESLYYAFNTEEEDGALMLEAAALFLAERYAGGEHGMVYDWVIANEVNQKNIWNYMQTDDLSYYTQAFEKSFRIFYNAIKSAYSNANVYFSIDHDWNDNMGDNSSFFNGRDFVLAFNEIAKEGGLYNWGIAIHPYPQPLSKVRFWEGEFDKSDSAKYLTPMNFSTITDLLTRQEFLDRDNNVRNLAVTELGFTSSQGEKLQAAAYAYCYYIIDNNEYIKSFLLNRQTDADEELVFGLAFGLYKKNLTPKYVVDVFGNIDRDAGEDYIPEMLEIIGAESLDEALEWAK